MELSFTAEQENFRAELREFLVDWSELEGFLLQGTKWKQVSQLFKAMAGRGWLSMSWPRQYGGLERGPAWEYLLWDEMARARAARNPLSAGIVARTLIRHGSEEQKNHWLPAIRSSELHFALGYSEPEAGSDLASLRCKATPRKDGYVIEGQKCWQSYADDMDCLWLLARTGKQDDRARGLSLFIVDLDAPGVSVKPIPIMDGDSLNEIFLDGVHVTADRRVGPENGAWTIMGEALADERHIQFPPGRLQRDLAEAIDWFSSRGLADDPLVRHRVAELSLLVEEARVHALRVLALMEKGQPAGVEAAANKVAHTDACQAIARALVELGGPEALLHGSRPELLYLVSTWESIGGGSSEIMRGIVARQGLGLGAEK